MNYPACEELPDFYNGTYGGGCEQNVSQCPDCMEKYERNRKAIKFITKKELIRQIKEDFKCPCSMASLKEPIEVSIKCRACNHELLRHPILCNIVQDGVGDGLFLHEKDRVNVQDGAKK